MKTTWRRSATNRGLMLSRTKTHVRREKSSEKSINGQWCPLSAICRLKTHRFRHIFHCPQYSDLSDKKSLTCETVPLSVKPLIPLSWHSLSGHQRKQVGQGGIPFRRCQPATAAEQRHQVCHIPGQTRQQRIYLSAIVVKGRIEVSPGEINAVHAGIQGDGIPAGPFPVVQQAVVPEHILRSFQGIRQPEQVVLFRQLAGAGAPEVIHFFGQSGLDAMPSPLSQQPADVLRDLPRKTPLLQGRGQPAGEKEVCLSSRPDAAVLPGQRQGNQAAPGKVPGLIQFRHGFFSPWPPGRGPFSP
nr:hypothetical protein [Klebsiella pneumoniae]